MKRLWPQILVAGFAGMSFRDEAALSIGNMAPFYVGGGDPYGPSTIGH